MQRPLTKKDRNGNLYTRPTAIIAAIDAALTQDPKILLQRAWVSGTASPDFVPLECLVHLIRDAWRRRDKTAMTALMVPFLARCEAILKVKVPDGEMPNAADIRENALSELSLLFVQDGTGDNPHELDFFEVRFNAAFRALYVDLVRHEVRRLRPLAPLPPENETADVPSDEDTSTRLSQVFHSPPNQEKNLFRNDRARAIKDLLRAIDALPPEEREAVILCYGYGYKEESDDPCKITAATLCNVTGRTIRNRLARAKTKLSRLKEEK